MPIIARFWELVGHLWLTSQLCAFCHRPSSVRMPVTLPCQLLLFIATSHALYMLLPNREIVRALTCTLYGAAAVSSQSQSGNYEHDDDKCDDVRMQVSHPLVA